MGIGVGKMIFGSTNDNLSVIKKMCGKIFSCWQLQQNSYGKKKSMGGKKKKKNWFKS